MIIIADDDITIGVIRAITGAVKIIAIIAIPNMTVVTIAIKFLIDIDVIKVII